MNCPCLELLYSWSWPSIHPSIFLPDYLSFFLSILPSLYPEVIEWVGHEIKRITGWFLILWTWVAADNLISLLSDWLILNTSAWPDRFTSLPHHFWGLYNSVVFWMKILNDSLQSNFDFKVHCNCRVPVHYVFFAYKLFSNVILSGL